MRHIAFIGLAWTIVLLSFACSDDDAADVTPMPSATTAASLRPSVTPSPAPSVTPEQTDTPTPEPEAESSPEPPDLEGDPFSNDDIRQAAEKGGSGYSFWYVEREPLCPQTSVPEFPVWSANLAGSDFGPVLVLWLYPDEAQLRQEWDVSGERPRSLLDGCEPPTEFVYWNANAMLAFEVWLSVGEELGLVEHSESPDDHPAVRSFLDLVP